MITQIRRNLYLTSERRRLLTHSVTQANIQPPSSTKRRLNILLFKQLTTGTPRADFLIMKRVALLIITGTLFVFSTEGKLWNDHSKWLITHWVDTYLLYTIKRLCGSAVMYWCRIRKTSLELVRFNFWRKRSPDTNINDERFDVNWRIYRSFFRAINTNSKKFWFRSVSIFLYLTVENIELN